MVNELTNKKQYKVNIIQDKNGTKLSERDNIRNRWAEYCTELYNEQPKGDLTMRETRDFTNDYNYGRHENGQQTGHNPSLLPYLKMVTCNSVTIIGQLVLSAMQAKRC